MKNDRIACAFLYAITKHGYPPPASQMKKYIDEMVALGFDSIELEGIHEEHLSAVYSDRENIKAKLADMGVKVPYFCAVLPKLSSLDPAVQNEQINLFRMGCEIAELWGAEGILDNAPLPPYQFDGKVPVVRHYDQTTFSQAKFSTNWEEYWAHLVKTYQGLCDIAMDHGLTVQVHPAEGLIANSTDGFLLFSAEVQRDNLKFNFDTANLFAQKENLPLALIRLKDHVDYIHVSDNGGLRYEHLAIGAGQINWPLFWEAVHRIGFKGKIGVDIGGAESAVEDLDTAYNEAFEHIYQHL